MAEIYDPADPIALVDALLWRRSDASVIRAREDLSTDYGATFVGVYNSPTIFPRNPQDPRLGDLRSLILRYQAAAGSCLSVQASGDGGDTWRCSVDPSPTLEETGAQGSNTVKFDFFNVVGHNIVFRILFPCDGHSLVLGWVAELNVRSEWEYENLALP